MSEEKKIRLNKVIKELNISLQRAAAFLEENGLETNVTPNTKISEEVHQELLNEFASDKIQKKASEEISKEQKAEKQAIIAETKKEDTHIARPKLSGVVSKGKIDLETGAPIENKESAPQIQEEDTPKEEKQKEEPMVITEEKVKAERPGLEIKGKIDLDEINKKSKPKSEYKAKEEQKKEVVENKKEDKPIEESNEAKLENSKEETTEPEVHKTNYKKLDGIKTTGKKVDLTAFEEDKKRRENEKKAQAEARKKRDEEKKKKRKRITVDKDPNVKSSGGGYNKDNNRNKNKNKKAKFVPKKELTEEEIQKQIKETLDKLTSGGKSKGSKIRKEKREERKKQFEEQKEQEELESKVLQVGEFVSVSELANMMDVPVNEVIAACMNLGIMVTMNQRLDGETLELVASEFGYDVQLAGEDIEEVININEEYEGELEERAPIVTVMGHVDHGKTSLLDYIREANVIAGEAGGITQHIGAYVVNIPSGQKIAFLDTPGHEAFTAMRARGTQVTDIVIIVIAADDSIMPQTKEAISHAQAAGVPMIFAINKIDKPAANPEKVKEELAGMNLLVEDWGGKIQSQDLSAKTGEGVPELLEKVLLESELLELKAAKNRPAIGTVIEASLDKGRGYVSTILVQNGTLKIGDYILAGQYHGKVRAMFDERGHNVKSAGPSTPVSILGLDGAPQAGDKFHVFEDEKEAKNIAARREQVQREQSVRAQKHITLDEIGRRIAVGDFQELNLIVKGDVDGSVEALTDSFQKLSTEEILVKIIHRGVGQITESDVLLASASDAIIIGFNVRPSTNARAIAEKEQVDIRSYSIIYDAINDLKDAMEGLLSPEIKEEVTGNVEVRETFKISKVGTIAGCMVLDGKVERNSLVRIVREGVVVHTGKLSSLKRFQDDAKEVTKGYECGLSVENYNDIRVNDILEAFKEVEVRKKL